MICLSTFLYHLLSILVLPSLLVYEFCTSLLIPSLLLCTHVKSRLTNHSFNKVFYSGFHALSLASYQYEFRVTGWW